MGAMFVPTVIAKTVARRYDLEVVQEIEELSERYYAISAGRRLMHPEVLAIRTAAREAVFA